MQYCLKHLPKIFQILKKELRLAIIYSGHSKKRDAVLYETYNTRPWKSYASVAEGISQSLQGIGFEHVYLIPDDLHMIERLRKNRIHMAWLNTAGVQGRHSICHASAMLEMLGVPYLGHDPLASSVMDNKVAFKRMLRGLGINTAPFLVWDPLQPRYLDRDGPLFRQAFSERDQPLLVKPANGRASKLIFIVRTNAELNQAVEYVYEQTHNHVLIEEYLPGREFCVAAGPRLLHRFGRYRNLGKPFVFSHLERRLSENELIFSSMDEKPIDASRANLLDAEIDRPIMQQLDYLATQICTRLGLTTLVRLDARSNAEGELHVLEVNPKPDISEPTEQYTSLVAMGLQSSGMSYRDLIITLLASHLDYAFTFLPRCVKPVTDLLTKSGLQLQYGINSTVSAHVAEL